MPLQEDYLTDIPVDHVLDFEEESVELHGQQMSMMFWQLSRRTEKVLTEDIEEGLVTGNHRVLKKVFLRRH